MLKNAGLIPYDHKRLKIIRENGNEDFNAKNEDKDENGSTEKVIQLKAPEPQLLQRFEASYP